MPHLTAARHLTRVPQVAIAPSNGKPKAETVKTNLPFASKFAVFRKSEKKQKGRGRGKGTRDLVVNSTRDALCMPVKNLSLQVNMNIGRGLDVLKAAHKKRIIKHLSESA